MLVVDVAQRLMPVIWGRCRAVRLLTLLLHGCSCARLKIAKPGHDHLRVRIHVRPQTEALPARSLAVARYGASQLAAVPLRTGTGTSRVGAPSGVVQRLSRPALADDVLSAAARHQAPSARSLVSRRELAGWAGDQMAQTDRAPRRPRLAACVAWPVREGARVACPLCFSGFSPPSAGSS